MEQSPHILVVSPDASLQTEFEQARGGMRDVHTVVWFSEDYRQGVEAARNRRPDILLVEMEPDIARMRDFVEEVAAVAPEAQVVSLYRPEVFGPEDSESQFLVEGLRAGIRDFVARPLSSADLEQLIRRMQRRPSARRTRLGRTVSFISNKGGVGKSTLSANVAVRMAERHPDRVLLIDGSLQLGVCSYILDLQPKTTIVDAIRERLRLDETLLRQLTVEHESGLRLLAAPADALEAAEVEEDGIAHIIQLARRSFDYVIVDTFPMLDSLVMAVLDLSDMNYIVFQGTVPNVAGTRRLLKVIKGIGIPENRCLPVLNQNYAEFPGNLRPADVQRQLGRDLAHVFPYNKKVVAALNTGTPFAYRAGYRFGFGKALENLADEIEEGVQLIPDDDGDEDQGPDSGMDDLHDEIEEIPA